MLVKLKHLNVVKFKLNNVNFPCFSKAKSDNWSFSKLLKITINRGLGSFSMNQKLLQASIDEFRLITGQHPKFIYSKKSIAGFKLREKTLIGLKVTLRNLYMYSFLERLIHLTLPQLPDFKGFSIKNFDLSGHYNFGIHDQVIFPEISYETITQRFGFNITLVFLSKNKEQNILLLKRLGFPFQSLSTKF